MNMSDKGLDAIIKSLGEVADKTEEMSARALYQAAGLIADEVKNGLNGLTIQEDPDGTSPHVGKGQKLHGVTSAQKADLIAAMGIAKFRRNDEYTETSIGFHGVGSTKSKKHPGGLPNRILMRAVESGSSIRQKTPVVRPAMTRAKAAAVKKAEAAFKNELKKEV